MATSIPSKDSTGLMAFWADIDPTQINRYQQWHNCEHIPERVSIPGFTEGRRYRALDNSPSFLMYYDTETTSVLSSEAYMAALNAPTPWTREALTWFRKPTRDIFTRVAVVSNTSVTPSATSLTAASYITSMRFDLGDGTAEDDYATRWIEAAAQQEHVQRVRFYKADSAIRNIGTNERKVHGGGPGKQTYLVLIEESLPPNEKESVINKADTTMGGKALQRENEESNQYWLEFMLRK